MRAARFLGSTTSWRALVAVVASAAIAAAATAQAAEITVISTIVAKSAVEELGPRFERRTGHKLAITFGGANALKREIEAGEPFDLAIMTAAVADDLIKQGKLVAATRTNVARGGIGIAVRAGAPKPDIGTVDALKRALLATPSITYAKEAGSGSYFVGLLERLGIAEAMRPKTRYGGGNVAEVVVAGEAEMAVQLITELMSVRGVAVVGPLPAEVQNYIVLTAGVGTQAKDPALAKEFLQFLTAPAAAPVYTSKGLEPGSTF
jgi:molybdate transport system substrate-binding protein